MAEAPSATGERRERKRLRWQAIVIAAHRTDVRLAALWLALGAGLALITSRIADWYVMTDELFYERLAISVAHSHSPLPHVHGELVGNVNQLYPLLLAPLFHDTLVPPALLHAHVLNAFVMSSASIPAFLLARSVTRDTRLSYVVAFLTVCVPWMTLSSFLMTEVVGYPDSKKFGVVGLADPVAGVMGAKVRLLIKEQPSVDYYEGEAID